MSTTRNLRWYVLGCALAAILLMVGMVVRRGPAKPHYVTLTWNPPAVRAGITVAGYNVYRRTAESTSFAKIAEKVAGPPYDDRLVGRGRKYVYVVTSVDTAGRESGFSAPATAVIPPY